MSPPLRLDLDWLSDNFPGLSHFQLLNSGGFKTVFACDHNALGSIVLKILHTPQGDEETRREIAATNQIDSKRIPKILDMGSVDIPIVGLCVYLIEERINGSTLRQLLTNGPLGNSSLLKLGLEVLQILGEAEQAKIVHRDVKPENIMLDNASQFWLLDFGIARHLALDSLTASGLPFGKFTLGYAPPEQMRNVKSGIDCRADMFALGVTLYESATGVNPFTKGARDDFEKISRVEHMQLPKLSLNFASADDFAGLVDTMVQKQRHHRPASVAEAISWMRDICSRANMN